MWTPDISQLKLIRLFWSKFPFLANWTEAKVANWSHQFKPSKNISIQNSNKKSAWWLFRGPLNICLTQMSDRCAVKLFSYQPSLSAPSTGTWTSGIGMLSKFLPFCHQRRETDQSQSSDRERNSQFLHQPSPPTIVIRIKRPLMRAVVLFIKAWNKSNWGVCWVQSGLINTFKTPPSYKRSAEHASKYLVP